MLKHIMNNATYFKNFVAMKRRDNLNCCKNIKTKWPQNSWNRLRWVNSCDLGIDPRSRIFTKMIFLLLEISLAFAFCQHTHGKLFSPWDNSFLLSLVVASPAKYNQSGDFFALITKCVTVVWHRWRKNKNNILDVVSKQSAEHGKMWSETRRIRQRMATAIRN